MTTIERVPVLTIPNVTEGSADFKGRLTALIREQGTHIYIDASFLMWMTKIGSRRDGNSSAGFSSTARIGYMYRFGPLTSI